MKLFKRAESIASVTFTLKTTIHQKENTERYFYREFINNSRLSVRRTEKASYRIWDSAE